MKAPPQSTKKNVKTDERVECISTSLAPGFMAELDALDHLAKDWHVQPTKLQKHCLRQRQMMKKWAVDDNEKGRPLALSSNKGSLHQILVVKALSKDRKGPLANRHKGRQGGLPVTAAPKVEAATRRSPCKPVKAFEC